MALAGTKEAIVVDVGGTTTDIGLAVGGAAAVRDEVAIVGGYTLAVRAVQEQGYHEVVLCSEAARPLVKASSAREIPHLAVLSSLEVAGDVTVESLGETRLDT